MIEILTVIAIIAVIVGILFPVFARVRESARTRTCISNLSQLGIAFQVYMQDYDGWLPSSKDILAGRGIWVALSPPCTFAYQPGRCHYLPEQGVIYPYVRDARIYVCPSDPWGAETRLSYAMNVALGTEDRVVHESRITKPASTVLLVEQPYNTVFHSPGFAGGYGDEPRDVPIPCHTEGERCVDTPSRTYCFRPVACYHNNATNVLFVDGHVKTMPQGTLKSSMFWRQQ